jgi:diguanylate cyclase (GGDEF)-like protein/PAS domain S-box-containing protein
MESDRLASVFATTTAALGIVGADGRILDVNPALCAIAGCEPSDLVGHEFWRFISDSRSYEAWAATSGGLRALDTERPFVRPDGTPVVLALHVRPHHVDGQVAWFVVHVEDRTEQRRAEAEIRAVESRFTSAFERAPVGMALVDLDGGFLRVNGALGALVGRTDEQLLDLTFQDITHPDDLEADLRLVQQLLDGRVATYDIEKRFVRPDGSVTWVLKSASLVRDDEGEPRYFVSQFQDIRARKEIESTLEHRSMHDQLTGLPNRALLLDRLNAAAARPRSDDETFAVLFVDVDRFKSVNDDLGHAAGDEVLIEVGLRLSAGVRATDTVARFGGDEFVVIADVKRPAEAALLAGRIAEAVSEPVSIHGAVRASVGASVGVAVFGHPHHDVEALLVEADAAMYRVKRAGREALAGLA